eukprot:4830445-Pyramimonas_sp.AAC.1
MAPPLPESASRLLHFYFHQHPGIDVSDRLRPNWGRLASIALAPSGSAPGVDGEPYKAYHPGARFVACLIAQAWHAADLNPALLDGALGPSVDLL